MNRISSALLISMISAVALSAIGAGTVVINEVELNPPGNATKWVELYNDDGEDVDISGWVVSVVKEPWTGAMPIPQGTVIPSNGYYLAEGNEQWSQDYEGSVKLVNGEGTKVDETHLITDDSDSDFTYGRYPNGHDTGQVSDWMLMRASPRAENTLL